MSSTFAQMNVLVITLVANCVIFTIQQEELQLPFTIILQQPLLHIKLTTERPSSKVPTLFPSSTMTAMPQVIDIKVLLLFSPPFFTFLAASACCLYVAPGLVVDPSGSIFFFFFLLFFQLPSWRETWITAHLYDSR